MSSRYKTVRLAGRDLPIAYSSNAIRLLENASGMKLRQFALLLTMGKAGFGFLQMFLWAGLEGGRLRKKAGRPLSLEDVGDLIDDTDNGPSDVWRDQDNGMEEVEVPNPEKPDEMVKVLTQVRPAVDHHPVMLAIMEAWFDAFPKARPDAPAENPPMASESSPAGTNS